MRHITLTQGLHAIVDDDDFEHLSQWKWHARKGTRPGVFYATRTVWISSSKKEIIHMHRVVNKTPSGLLTDHINGNGLDNRKSNLRNATTTQNLHNSALRSDNASGYRGVYWQRDKRKWTAEIKTPDGKRRLGRFSTKEEAAEAYREAAKQYHGEFYRSGQ